MAKKNILRISPNEQKMRDGCMIIKNHVLFGKLRIDIDTMPKGTRQKGTAAYVYESGDIRLNPDENFSPEEWAYIIAHCMLHLCFGHFEKEKMPGYFRILESSQKNQKEWVVSCDKALWNMACDMYITKFLADIKFGTSVNPIQNDMPTASDERKLYEMLVQKNINFRNNFYGTACPSQCDMIWNGFGYRSRWNHSAYSEEFAYAVAHSVRSVISQAGGEEIDSKSRQQRAADWFISHYPLLGGLASGFKILEVGFGTDAALATEISIAAIDITERKIYVNSSAGLDFEEWKFVLAHEYLHAGLQHHERCQGRNPYLWNVACDYVINGWLKEMQIGSMPSKGLLYDETLQNQSAEEIYDILVKNLRKHTKLETFRGYGQGDIMDRGYAESKIQPTSLDDFCKSALRSGLEYHQNTGRGLIPASLLEEIKALSVPPIPWDVELAKWFDIHFSPVERKHTYARPSRRQSSTPDIPRPGWMTDQIPENSRTFAVIIDTSGSMSPKLIGMALGATASYSVAKEVPLVRVVFCDAAAYDAGYLSPEDIAGRVEVKGRGGTILQPAVDLLESAKDFPENGAILIITDGEIEADLHIHHEHAFLIPKGKYLPFRPKGEVFYFGSIS